LTAPHLRHRRSRGDRRSAEGRGQAAPERPR